MMPRAVVTFVVDATSKDALIDFVETTKQEYASGDITMVASGLVIVAYQN